MKRSKNTPSVLEPVGSAANGKQVEPTESSSSGGVENGSLLLKVNELARLLGISERSIWRLQSKGHLPPSIRLAGSIRWRRGEVEAWVDAGCPMAENSR